MKTKMKMVATAVVVAALAGGFWAWKSMSGDTSQVAEMEETEKVNPVGPTFNADSAYAFCAAQCDFGYRSMNTEAHDQCADWIADKFRSYGCEVVEQRADLKGYDGTTLKARNIMASYRPEATIRILLCAHYDSRPWADNDPDSANWRKPIMGANDGASGVAVMLEIARLLRSSAEKPGQRLVGAIRLMMVTHGHWGRNTGARTCPRAARLATASCWTWWEAKAHASTRRACPCSMRRK